MKTVMLVRTWADDGLLHFGGEYVIRLHEGATFASLIKGDVNGGTDNIVYLYYFVDTDKPLEEKRVLVTTDGNLVPENAAFLASGRCRGGHSFHVFELRGL